MIQHAFRSTCFRAVMLGGVLVSLSGLAGCGGAAKDEGVPANVDMTKDFSPPVDMPGMSPKIQAESTKKAAAAPATP